MYEGEWKNNNMHGKGIYTWKDGRKYEGSYLLIIVLGEYTMDKKHGKGAYTWADGRKYDGMWYNGKQHGEGVYYDASGATRRGEWENGKRIKWLDNDDGNQHQSLNDDEPK